MRSITSSFLTELQKNIRKTNKKVWINWDNDTTEDANEIITDDVESLTINSKSEGELGQLVIDRATITVNDANKDYSPKNVTSQWDGNIVPMRPAEISLGVGTDLLNVFSGKLKSIKPSSNSKTSISIDDEMLILKKTDCPDTFYYNEQVETIIKTWLDSLGYTATDYDLNTTNTSINYCFEGMKMLEGIKLICESLSAKFYFQNGKFYFKTRLSSDYSSESSSIYTFDNKNKGTENVWTIDEEYGVTDIYNRVVIESNPLVKQNKQIVWTGAEDNSEITEEYLGSDINASKELQLTYVPDGGDTEQPTKNVPIISDSVNILDLTSGIEDYKLGDGISSINEDTGLITFSDTVDKPLPDPANVLSVNYQYYFNQIPANNEKRYFIELDNYTINIDNLIIYAKDESENELTVSFTNSLEDIYVTQELSDNCKRVEVNIVNNTATKAILYGKINNREIPNLLLKGEPYKQTSAFKVSDQDQPSIDAYDIENTLSIQNDLINTNDRIKKLVQYLLWKHSTPKSKLKVKAIGVPHLELEDVITILQENRTNDDEEDFIIKGINQKVTRKNKWEITLDLVQAYTDNWTYTELGTPVLGGDNQEPSEDTDAPNQVNTITSSLIEAELQKNYKVKIEWDINNATDFSHYNVYRQEDGFTYNYIVSLDDRNTIEYIDSGVEYGKTYNYKVVPVDQSSNQADIDTALSTSITVSANAGVFEPNFKNSECYFTNEVYLEWDGIAGTEVYEIRTDTNWGTNDSNLIYKGKDLAVLIGHNHPKFPISSTETYNIRLTDKGGNHSTTDSILLENDTPSAPTINTSSSLSQLFLEVTSNLPDDIKHIRWQISDDGFATTLNDFTVEDISYSMLIPAEGTLDIRAAIVDIFNQQSSWVTTTTNTNLITKEDMQGSIFQITPTVTDTTYTGTLSDLWDMDTSTGITLAGAGYIQFEYPIIGLYDMVRFYGNTSCNYYVQISQNGIDWTNVQGSSLSPKSYTANQWNTDKRFDSNIMYAAKYLRIYFDRSITVTELKFWKVTLADEILAQTMTLTNDMQIINEDGSVTITSTGVTIKDSEGNTTISGGKISTNVIEADMYKEIRNVLPYNYLDSLDADKSLICDFYIPSETENIISIKLSAKGLPFRAYSKSAAYQDDSPFWDSGVGDVTLDTQMEINTSETILSNVGGHSHSYDKISGISEGSHSHGASFSTTSTYSDTNNGTGISQTDETGDSFDGYTPSPHSHNLGSFGNATAAPNNHKHYYDKISGVSVNTTNSSHSHTYSTTSTNTDGFGDGQHSHSFDQVSSITNLNSHSHNFDGSHAHGLDFGIHEDTTPSGVQLFCDNGSGFSTSADYTLNVAPNESTSYILSTEKEISSKFTGSGWKRIKLTSNRLGRINAQLIAKVDITA